MTSKTAKPIDYRFWNLSTRHISLADAKLLPESPCLIVYEHEYGWLILVPQDDFGETMADVVKCGFSLALQAMLRLAFERGIRMIRFDCDVDVVTGLETFDW